MQPLALSSNLVLLAKKLQWVQSYQQTNIFELPLSSFMGAYPLGIATDTIKRILLV
jgi:hypothetical protein